MKKVTVNSARIPGELATEEAAPLMWAGITTFNALRNSGGRADDLAAIQGIGGLGDLGIQFASKSAFETIPSKRFRSKELRKRMSA